MSNSRDRNSPDQRRKGSIVQFSIYTDGGCSGNKRDCNCPGSYAFVLLDPAKNELGSGSGIIPNTTNNRMEMTAVIEGCRALKKMTDLHYGGATINECHVFTDSRYVVDNFNDYIVEWHDNGWRRSAGGSVINIDLWKSMYVESKMFKTFKINWVKGHSTNPLNQKVDGMVRRLLYKEG